MPLCIPFVSLMNERADQRQNCSHLDLFYRYFHHTTWTTKQETIHLQIVRTDVTSMVQSADKIIIPSSYIDPEYVILSVFESRRIS